MVILFDIDGTLIDHDQAEARAVASMHPRLSLGGAVEDFHDRWRAALERHYARFLAGEVSIQEQRRARIRELVDSSLSDDAADALIATYLDEYLSHCRLYPDVEPALSELSSYRLGVISNGDLGQQRTKLARNGIAERFDTMVMSADCGIAKPAAGIFHLACTRMDVPPSQAVYVGDRRDIDAEAARAAGLHAIWVDRAGTAGPGEPIAHVRSLSALPAMVAGIQSDTAPSDINPQ
jgi:putative hydrolase of the HAD superfamily